MKGKAGKKARAAEAEPTPPSKAELKKAEERRASQDLEAAKGQLEELWNLVGVLEVRTQKQAERISALEEAAESNARKMSALGDRVVAAERAVKPPRQGIQVPFVEDEDDVTGLLGG